MAKEVEAAGSYLLGAVAFQVFAVEIDIIWAFENNDAVFFQDISFIDDFNRVGKGKQLVRGVEENNIEFEAVIAELDDAAVVIAFDNTVMIGGYPDFVDIMLECFNGVGVFFDKDDVFGAARKGFDADVPGTAKAVEEESFPDIIMENVEKREFDFRRSWAYIEGINGLEHSTFI